jgi:hypothetical protein
MSIVIIYSAKAYLPLLFHPPAKAGGNGKGADLRVHLFVNPVSCLELP